MEKIKKIVSYFCTSREYIIVERVWINGWQPFKVQAGVRVDPLSAHLPWMMMLRTLDHDFPGLG